MDEAAWNGACDMVGTLVRRPQGRVPAIGSARGRVPNLLRQAHPKVKYRSELGVHTLNAVRMPVPDPLEFGIHRTLPFRRDHIVSEP